MSVGGETPEISDVVPGMSLTEAMTTQRAIRRLTDEQVSDDLVRKLIGLAVKAPTAQNDQGWEFIVVRDPKVKARLAKVNRRTYKLAGPAVARRHGHDETFMKVHRATQYQADHFEDIPVLVVCCMRNARVGWPPIIAASSYGSIMPAVQNLLLAARAAGLGATLTTMPLISNWWARRILGLPWGITPVVVVPLGWPKGRYGPTTRRPVEEVVSIDTYGNRAWLDD